MSHRAAVITVSDRSAAGEREDKSGPVAADALRAAGFECGDTVIVPDGADSVESALRAALAAGARLIVTSGGTGIGPRDETPEGAARVITREVPGIAEELRRRGTAVRPGGMLSRAVAGVAPGSAGEALIVTLPGSPGGVSDGIELVLSVAAHAIDQLGGGDHS